jgi:pimeloyl-ACP methyl ester carboxylesterase
MSAESRFLDARGLRFHYRDWGGAGRPLVLLHGLASNARIWDLVAPLLAGRQQVIALDQRGHGLTSKPDDGYDFASIGDDLAAVVAALELKRSLLVGHSWGAGVALHYAMERPDAVAGLVLVDGGFLEISAWPEMTWERTVQLMSPPPLAGMKLEAFLLGARSWPGLGDLWSDDVQEIVLANFEIDGDGAIYPRLSRDNHLKILRALWEQKPSQMWSRLRCPALLVPAAGRQGEPARELWREHKRKGIALAEEAAPSLRVEWMEDTIHDVPLQRPRELADAIERFAKGLG